MLMYCWPNKKQGSVKKTYQQMNNANKEPKEIKISFLYL